jgi:hypothetical protein
VPFAQRLGLREVEKGVFCDESVFNSGRGGNTKLVRRERGIDNAVQDEFLNPTFESGRFSQPFWAAIKHGTHMSLVPIRKRTPDKRKHRDDKLGVDTDQHTHEILEAELIPFIKSLPGGVLSLRCRARRWWVSHYF